MISFFKYSGSGNDFILFDDLFDDLDTNQIISLCDRHRGIGADGVLQLLPSLNADVFLHIINADGSIPSMCGNGLMSAFVHLLKNSSQSLQIETKAKTYTGRRENDLIAINMGELPSLLWKGRLDEQECYLVNTGVPHLVAFEKNLNPTLLLKKGKELRFHPQFAPDGTNVTFIKILSDEEIQYVTYERGVEAITQACGTGAMAASVVARHLNLTKQDVRLIPISQNSSFIEIGKSLIFKGSAEKIFEGKISLPSIASV